VIPICGTGYVAALGQEPPDVFHQGLFIVS